MQSVIGHPQHNPPAGTGRRGVAIGKVQLAAFAVEAQVQLELIARAHQLLEFQHFHAAESGRQVQQLLAQAQGPVDLHHAGQYRSAGEVAAEVRKVRRHDQSQVPFTVGFDLLQHFGALGRGAISSASTSA